jgi:photosystem II stability/assembly factor-like uncharacterized protein
LIVVIALAAGLYLIRLPRASGPPAPTPSTPALQVTSMYFATDQVGWVGTLLANTSSGPILATVDGGKHWTRQLSLPASAATSIRFFDTRRGYVLEVPFGAPGSPPSLYATADGGGTWTRLETPPNEFAGASVDFADYQHGWFATFPFERQAGTGPFKLYSTSDAGVHWKPMLDVGPAQPDSHGVHEGVLDGVWFADAAHGWLMASEPGRPALYKTIDGGQTWARAALTPPIGVPGDAMFYLTQPLFREGGSGVLGVFTQDASVIYGTTDAGRSWSPPRPLPASNPPHLAMPDAGHVWAAIDSKIWSSADFGASWQELAMLKGSYIFGELFAIDAKHAWAASVLPGPCPGNATVVGCITTQSPGKLLASTDGGRRWSEVVLPA